MKNFNAYKIDEYLLGNLSNQERLDLEKVMQSNPTIAAEVKRRTAVVNHIKALEHKKMQQQIADIHLKERSHQDNIRPIKRYRIMAIAAAILFLLSASWWVWDTNNDTSQNLYAQYYESYELRFGQRGTNDLLSEAGGYYIDGEYAKAIPLLEQVTHENPKETKAVFALGIAHMEMQRWEKALPYFQSLIEDKDILYTENAKWYMALSLYQLHRLEEATVLLQEISQNKNAKFSAAATQFLKKIKNK